MRAILALPLAAVLLSFVAVPQSQAGVVVTGDNTVVVPSRRSDANQEKIDEINRKIKKKDIQIYTDGSNSGQAFMMKDGKVVPLADGEYQLPNGQKVNIKNGRLNGQFGNGDINNNIKILPRN